MQRAITLACALALGLTACKQNRSKPSPKPPGAATPAAANPAPSKSSQPKQPLAKKTQPSASKPASSPDAAVSAAPAKSAAKSPIEKLHAAVGAVTTRTRVSELLVKHGVAASQAEPCKDIWLGNHVSMLAPTKNFVKGPTALVVRAMPAATAKDKGTTACWISTEMVNNKVRWLVRPGAAPLADATTYRFKQLGNCWLVRFEAKSKVIEGAGPFHKHEWYTYMAASKDGVDVFEVTTYRARGTVPKTEQEERGTVRWLRVGKRHFLVHVLTKTTDDDDAKPSKETNVYALGADCMLVQLNKAEATKIRAQPGGKALPLPT